MKVVFAPGSTSVPEDCTLVLPGVSVGNVGQQAVDLVVQTLRERAGEDAVVRLGDVTSPCLRALAGADVFKGEHGTIHTAATLYHVPSAKLLLLQQRALVHEGFEEAFAVEVAEFQVETRCAGCVVLAGTHAFMRDDAALRGPQVTPVMLLPEGVVESPVLAGMRAAFTEAFTPLPVPATPAGDEETPAAIAVAGKAFSSLFGAGLAVRHLRRSAAAGLPAAAVLVYVDEGTHNAADAGVAAAVLQGMFALLPAPTSAAAARATGWVAPPSWDVPEGPAPPPDFYI